ncbi:hypothetical protein D3C87_2030030 [compost metagenome]
MVEQPYFQEIPEILRRVGSDANVLVHMKRIDFLPLNARLVSQSRQKLVLRRRRSEDDIHKILGILNLPDLAGNGLSRGFTHFLSGFGDVDFQ